MSLYENKLYVQLVHPSAVIPTRGTPGSAGYDLTCVDDNISIEPFSTVLVQTGLKIMIPTGYYGRIAPRSGVSVKKRLLVNAGVIDEDYRGEVKIVLVNPTRNIVTIEKGEKIAQLIIEKISTPEVVKVDNLEDTVRGENGFGSTGK